MPPSITSDSEVASPKRPFSVAAENGSNDLSSRHTLMPSRQEALKYKDTVPIMTINQLVADYPLIKEQLTALKEQILKQQSTHKDELSRVEIKCWNLSVQTGGKALGPSNEDQNDNKSQFEERLEGLQCKLAQAEYEIQQLSIENQQLNTRNQELRSEIELLEEEARIKDQVDDESIGEEEGDDDDVDDDDGYYYFTGNSAATQQQDKETQEMRKEDEIMLQVDGSWT
jgi:hypothetical protein